MDFEGEDLDLDDDFDDFGMDIEDFDDLGF